MDNPTTKHCRTCKTTKPLSEFTKCRRAPDGHDWKCRACKAAEQRRYYTSEKGRAKKNEWYRNNADKVAASRRQTGFGKSPEAKRYRKKWALRKRYNLGIEDYERMVTEQGGKCAICLVSPEKALRVDHNHSTGKVRALLCDPCNVGLANFRENPDSLQAAIEYLKKWKTSGNG